MIDVPTEESATAVQRMHVDERGKLRGRQKPAVARRPPVLPAAALIGRQRLHARRSVEERSLAA
jgi:hypothetical protein